MSLSLPLHAIEARMYISLPFPFIALPTKRSSIEPVISEGGENNAKSPLIGVREARNGPAE